MQVPPVGLDNREFFFQEQNLKSDTVLGQAADAIGDDVGNFAADGVVSAGVIVGRVLLARNELLRTEQSFVGPRFDFI